MARDARSVARVSPRRGREHRTPILVARPRASTDYRFLSSPSGGDPETAAREFVVWVKECH